MTAQLEGHIQEVLTGVVFARWTDNARRAWASNLLRIIDDGKVPVKDSIIEILIDIKKGILLSDKPIFK